MKTSQKKQNIKRYGALLLSAMITSLAINQVQALPLSQNVAIITTPSVVNGGTLPTVGPAYSGFTFSSVSNSGPADFAAALAPNGACGASGCDTVVLNAASSSNIRCNLNVLTATQKADLVSFVFNGGKMIMYDSECSTQNYSWLPYPFTTNNPGAQGAQGTLTIVEENGLSTSTLGSLYINAPLLASQTDAIGDMNVMTTLDANWCLDMSGTNVTPLTGPVHTYARYGSGLFLYNGMDVDVLNASTQPETITGRGNLAKIWHQELLVPFNPTPSSVLPCGMTVVGINLTPPNAINDLSIGETEHTVTATLADLLGAPEVGVEVTFTVLSGSVNAGVLGTCSANLDCTTDANGEVSFTYSSNNIVGMDNIRACFVNSQQQTVCSQLVSKEWTDLGIPSRLCDADNDGDIDKRDLALISRSRGQLALPGDARDADGDGVITMRDVKICIPQCTLSRCAVQ